MTYQKVQGQKSLGDLHHVLSEAMTKYDVYVDGVRGRLTNPHSYRGYDEDIAFEFDSTGTGSWDSYNTVGDSLWGTFTGWKGGDYLMDDDTCVWISNVGDASGRAVVSVEEGIADTGQIAVLITTEQDQYAVPNPKKQVL